jgi:hypothetical protein|tara:strand:- start:7841 stop:8548 length:708 start_codon:yes stop_codon:yes gene_type:complete
MSLLDRKIRRVQNSKGNAISEGSSKAAMSHHPAKNNMSDGEQVFALLSNRTLALFKKLNGMLYKVNLSHDGNQIVDDKLTARRIEYINEFTDYRVFIHNFQDDLPGSEVFLPFSSPNETTTLLEEQSAYLTPFKMTCSKIIFRPEALNTNATDIVFKIKKVDNGDTTVDTVATFDFQTTFTNNTNHIITESDWDNIPTVDAGVVVGISITPDDTNITTSETEFAISSVWRTEIKV